MEPLKPHEVYVGQVIDADPSANFLDVVLLNGGGYCVAICENLKEYVVGDIVYCRADADGNFFNRIQHVPDNIRTLYVHKTPIEPPI